MDIDRIHAEIRPAIRRIPPLPFHNRLFVRLINLLLALAPEKKSIAGIALEQEFLSQAALRIYRPIQKLSGAGLLWMHGGGMITGRAAQDDRTCSALARRLGLVIFSLEYRLAPRHPFPAALDDGYEAWRWLQEKAHLHGVDNTRIAVAGQSAGGGLAAALAQKIHDHGGIQPAAQLLFCPMLDDHTAAQENLDTLNHRIWDNRSNRAAWSAYLGQPPGSSDVPPYAVPARRKDLAGLPPTWIGVGDLDLFRDESEDYAHRLQHTGVRCRLHRTPMAPHVFETIAPDSLIARELFEDSDQFLRQCLGIVDHKIGEEPAGTTTIS